MLMSVLNSVLVVLGIGLVIFVHELGHYMAARAVGIRVEVFSIGFGKKIWGFTRGGTEYKICLIPLGGYVKMAGEDPTRPTTGDPDEFGSKKVWERTLVISAGVVMNMVFALVTIPIAFSAGVRFSAPVIGSVAPGGAAWVAGIHVGDRILRIDGDKVLSFEDIVLETAVSSAPIVLTVERDGETLDITVPPRPGPNGFPIIGVGLSMLPRFSLDESLFSEDGKEGVELKQARALAAAGLAPGDLIVGLNGIPAKLVRPFWEAEVRIVGDGKLTLLVSRDGVEREVELAPVMQDTPDSATWRLGVRLVSESSAKVLKVVVGDVAYDLGLRAGDLLLSVNGSPLDPQKSLSEIVGEGRDPRRSATLMPFPDPPNWNARLTVQVRRASGEKQTLEAILPSRMDRVAFLNSVMISRELTTRVNVDADWPAALAGMQDGDVILAIDDRDVADFQDVVEIVRGCEGKTLKVRVRRGNEEKTIEVKPVWKPTRQNVVLKGVSTKSGIASVVTEVVQVPFPESIAVGFIYSGRMLKRVVSTLRSIFRGSVSAKNLGGPITIFRAAHQYSQIGLMRALLFLAVISINLAILNILPIPVLDGGWLMFLVIEKIKGSPVNERTMGYFQWMGLIMILGLMVFVTWNDLDRWFATLFN